MDTQKSDEAQNDSLQTIEPQHLGLICRMGGDFSARPERHGLALASGHGLPLLLK